MGFFSGLFSAAKDGFTGLGTTLVGSVLGGAISNAFDQSNNAVTTKQNLEAQKQLFEYQNRNKYQFMVDDLNKAGLNPLLAVNGLQGSSVGGVSGSSGNTDVAHINSARAQAEANRIALKNADTELFKAKSEALEKEANVKLAEALANRYNTLTPTDNAKSVAEIQFINNNIFKTNAEIDKIYSDIRRENRIADAQITELIERAKHLRVVTGNESINYDLLIRARDSKSEAIKRELLDMWQWQLLHNVGYMFDLVTGNSGIGATTAGKFGFRFK